MSVVVVNQLHLTVAPEVFKGGLESEFRDLIRGCPGFERFTFVRTAPDRAIVVIYWDSAEHAQAGAAVIGPTWFNANISPRLASEQQRAVGPVVADFGP
jgi:hypothetical protein